MPRNSAASSAETKCSGSESAIRVLIFTSEPVSWGRKIVYLPSRIPLVELLRPMNLRETVMRRRHNGVIFVQPAWTESTSNGHTIVQERR